MPKVKISYFEIFMIIALSVLIFRSVYIRVKHPEYTETQACIWVFSGVEVEDD